MPGIKSKSQPFVVYHHHHHHPPSTVVVNQLHLRRTAFPTSELPLPLPLRSTYLLALLRRLLLSPSPLYITITRCRHSYHPIEHPSRPSIDIPAPIRWPPVSRAFLAYPHSAAPVVKNRSSHRQSSQLPEAERTVYDLRPVISLCHIPPVGRQQLKRTVQTDPLAPAIRCASATNAPPAAPFVPPPAARSSGSRNTNSSVLRWD